MEKYFRTLYTCARKNIPPNDGLDAILCLQEENGLNFDEIKMTDEERRKSKKNTGEKVKSFRYCQPQEVRESLQCLAFPLKSYMVKCASESDGIVLVADETTDDSNCKQYNVNVCCLKNSTPEWFFGEMIEVENRTASVLAHALKCFVETTLEQSMTKVLATGFDGCNTNIGEANGVKSWLKKWNPYIVCFWCLAHRLNLTVKDAADNVVEVAQFKELMHSIYQYFKNSSVRESTFKKLQEVYKGKSIKILENKDQRWLTSDAASKRIYDLYPELVLNLENYAEMKNDSVAGGLAEGLLSRKNVACLMALRDVLPVMSTLCRMLQYTSGKDLTIEHFNDYYANCIDKLDELIENGGQHMNNLSNFLEVTCSNLDIGGRRNMRGRLDWDVLKVEIYKPFVANVKANIVERLGKIQPLVTSLAKLFSPVLVPGSIQNHEDHLKNDIRIICDHHCVSQIGFYSPFHRIELENYRKEWIAFMYRRRDVSLCNFVK